MLNKLIGFFKVLGIALVLLLLTQYLLSLSLNGNLVVSMVNESGKDSLSIDVYIDGEMLLENVCTNEFTHNYKTDVVKSRLGEHIVMIKSKDNNIHTSIVVNTFLVTWISVEIYNSTPDDFNEKYHVYIRKQNWPITIE